MTYSQVVHSPVTPATSGSVLPSWSGAHRTGNRRLRTSSVFIWIWSAIAVALVAVAVVFQLMGGRWFIIETPSMGEAAPVGTFVLDNPTTTDQVRVGDVISFHPPTSPDEVYTHRVVEKTSDGGVITRGDINGANDAWTLEDADLVGKAWAVLPGLGWLVRSVPWLIGGAIVVWLLSRFARTAPRRASWFLVGLSLVASLIALILKPFVAVTILSTDADPAGATAKLVSTGLLPIRVQALGGSHVDLASGQVGNVDVPTLTTDGYYRLATTLDLGFWGWVVFVAVCCIPLLYVLVIGLPPETPDEIAREDLKR